jgi:hypothetical protein
MNAREGRGASFAAASAAVFALLAVFASAALGLGAGGPKANSGQSFLGNLSNDGRFLVFHSGGSNLSPDDGSGDTDVFVRDLDTGNTQLVSRASGPTGIKGNCGSDNGTISGNGRYVAFESCSNILDPADTDTFDDIYVRDLQNYTTTLVSRASGANGAKANNLNSGAPTISDDGRYVAFYSQATNLDPADTDSTRDVFVRDMQTNTTTLVSRATGAAGAKGNTDSILPRISGDGRYVAFRSTATNLTPDDTDVANDIFRRDLQTNTTILVSRANGTTGVTGDRDSFTAAISNDGNVVAFGSNATNLTTDTLSGVFPVFVRDVTAGTTKLVTRATGATGAVGNGMSTQSPGISGDGRYVSFNSQSTNLDPDDTDALTDAFVRDRQTDTTTLVSRATGAAGAKGNGASSDFQTFTTTNADGRYVAFVSESTNLSPDDTDTRPDIYIRDRQAAFTSLESRASVQQPRPKSATPIDAPLVPVYDPCTTPNRVHAAPLSFSSCNPPALASDYLTMGTPDANGQLLKAVGYVHLRTINGDPNTTADEADVPLTVNMTDVRNQGTLSDYAGQLAGHVTLQITDRGNGPSNQEAATVQPVDLAFPVPCAATGDTTIGATCSLTTTIDTMYPGTVREQKRSMWELGRIRLDDGGADGIASTTGDNTSYLAQGILIP